ncbi:hypothetical protein [Streptomyces bobili]|uniref:hypothetical protein n=1 Tax=Streptomyces bobili TaxID=67280 RepID=UPI0037143BEC
MSRQEAIEQAEAAARQAAKLAAEADRRAGRPDYERRVTPFAQASAAWSDVARSFAAIAAVLPETEDTRG